MTSTLTLATDWQDITDRLPDLARAHGRTARARIESDIEPPQYDTDARRLAFDRGEWEYIGIMVEIRQATPTPWALDPVIGQSSLWNVESDSGAAYLTQQVDELLIDALEDARRLATAIRDLVDLAGE